MKVTSFNADWLFWKEGQEASKTQVTLPHDAMILEKRDPELPQGSNTGYFPGGKYVYSKTFLAEEGLRGQSVMLFFEGVYMNAKVSLNGEPVGGWIYGYTGFPVDLTEKLRIGEENTITVTVDNSQTPNSRWYSGSGIYRPVWLWTGSQTHIAPEGLMAETVSVEPAVLRVRAEVIGEADRIRYSVLDGETIIATAEGTGDGSAVEIPVPGAKLWTAETPNLYTVCAEVIKDDRVMDTAEIRTGLRVLSWSAEQGLQINGETVRLRGGCIHHDHGILGACAYEKSECRRVRKLKEFGFNAIRFSHYPAGLGLLKACDELGMYILDESFDQWRVPNTKYDYSTVFDQEWRKDLTALAKKDVSHPSVILYCIGNEIGDTGRSYGGALAKEMVDCIHAVDSTRPITLANNVYISYMSHVMEEKEAESNAPFGSIEFNNLAAELPKIRAELTVEKLEKAIGPSHDVVDIAGYNYATDLYQKIHELRPNRVFLSSETLPAKMAENWRIVRENDWVIGDFLWTAWDYLGEAGVGLPVYGTDKADFSKPYPCLTAACGSFDLNGNPEAAAYYEAILWGKFDKPFIAVRPVNHSGEPFTVGGWRLTDAVDCWTWPGCEGKTAEVIVYSPGMEVELLLNGSTIARKPMEDCKAVFELPYRPGKLTAICYGADGQELSRAELKTAGDACLLRAEPEETSLTATENDIVYVPIRLTDEAGTLRMNDERSISVAVQGPAELIALGSARPDPEESYQKTHFHAWHGAVLAVIRLTGIPGDITISASAEGCESAMAHLRAL